MLSRLDGRRWIFNKKLKKRFILFCTHLRINKKSVRYEKKIKTKIRNLLLHNKRECKLLVVSKACKGVDERRTFSKRSQEFYRKERMQTYRKLRKRKEWQATLIPFLCENMHRTFYSFALTSRSLKDFPFLHEIIRGSLKMWGSRGWFWIKCHFVSKACFKFDTFFMFDKFLIFSHLRGPVSI